MNTIATICYCYRSLATAKRI